MLAAMARVHHLNCGTMRPRGARLLAGRGGWLEPTRIVAHCLLIEAGDRRVLVDTGFGTGDAARPERLGQPYCALVRPDLAESETALRQVQAMGLDPAEVTDIVVTHLDSDHAGGLGDFPQARVHVFAPELQAALHPSARERARYLPAHWAHGPNWHVHEAAGDDWLGFESVRLLPDLGADVALVPLVGHTRGHCGVAIEQENGWLLHCGDAYFNRHEVETPPSCPPGLQVFQQLVCMDRAARDRNLQRLRELARERVGEVRLICSHDHELFDEAVRPGSSADAA
jgi:glyoxylase-like metal-dependent hydrolase (beta-lactamase superfamily II)